MAPTSKILAHSQTRSLNASSKWRSTIIIACGRSRMILSFLAVGTEPSVPCRSRFVYQMDKVEISRCPYKASAATGRLFFWGEHMNADVAYLVINYTAEVGQRQYEDFGPVLVQTR